MLQLKKTADAQTSDFQQKVETILERKAEVRTVTHEITIEVKDLDEITTKEEVALALSEQLKLQKPIPETAIKSMRKTYAGTQTAVVSLPASIANKALAAGKVRIGWVNCRLRGKPDLKRCYRCLGYGHHAKDCKSEDRSEHCYRCGEKGHKAKDCSSEPECMLCKGSGHSAKHSTGSIRCPAFQLALNASQKRT